jgi:hypothetical protein
MLAHFMLALLTERSLSGIVNAIARFAYRYMICDSPDLGRVAPPSTGDGRANSRARAFSLRRRGVTSINRPVVKGASWGKSARPAA